LAAVYRRRIEGQTLTLAPSGWTYHQTFVLYDKESGSLWFPQGRDLKGIQGRYFQKLLPGLPHEVTHWEDWLKKHPRSRLLK
jgi:hypothetical protein